MRSLGILRLAAPFLILCLGACSGTKMGNPTPPAPTSLVSVALGPVQMTQVSNLALCVSSIRIYPSGESATPISARLSPQVVTPSSTSTTVIGQASLNTGSYGEVDLSIDPICASQNSVSFANSNGTYNAGVSITAAFTGTFTISGAGQTVSLQMQPIVDQLATVTSSSQVSQSIESTPGHAELAGNPAPITANSCSAADVQAALNEASAGDTVVIPAGTCTWTSPVSWAVPGASGLVTTLQGQTTCTGSGDPALNSLSCVDKTIILDNLNRNGAGGLGDVAALQITPPSSGEFRLKGLTYGGAAGTSANKTFNGSIVIQGNSTSPGIRIDHNHFTSTNTADLSITGWIYGVVDHNIFYANYSDETLIAMNGSGWNGNANDLQGNASWTDGPHFGSQDFVYVEANYFYSTEAQLFQVVDNCNVGGRYVDRFNTMGTHVIPYTSGTGVSGNTRGCRAVEVYGNSSNWDSTGATDNYTFLNVASGSGMVWGNTLTGQVSVINEDYPRGNNSGFTQVASPSGWGYCGNVASGADSPWDQNSSAVTGYACLDQPGRGAGDLLSGLFPNTVDSRTNTIAWPNQASEPYYVWGNTFNPVSGQTNTYWVNNTGVAAENRDYYLQLPNYNEPSTLFDGTAGIGQGLLASLPSTCTPGVGYWATDQGSWNRSGNGGGQGVLYECTALNTWTPSYTPYMYPHPLDN